MENQKKKVINLPISDKMLAKKTGISVQIIGTRRREAYKLPSQKGCLTGDGKFFFEEGFAEYMRYYKSQEWQKEFEKIKKMKIKGA